MTFVLGLQLILQPCIIVAMIDKESFHSYRFAIGDQPWKRYKQTRKKCRDCSTRLVVIKQTEDVYCPKCKEIKHAGTKAPQA
jgi:Zn finger protein HypA/HybF involved in hydrogenase expression